MYFQVGIFLDFVRLTTRTPHGAYVGRTYGEPNEIELAPIGVELNGSRRVPVFDAVIDQALAEERRLLHVRGLPEPAMQHDQPGPVPAVRRPPELPPKPLADDREAGARARWLPCHGRRARVGSVVHAAVVAPLRPVGGTEAGGKGVVGRCDVVRGGAVLQVAAAVPAAVSGVAVPKPRSAPRGAFLGVQPLAARCTAAFRARDVAAALCAAPRARVAQVVARPQRQRLLPHPPRPTR